MTATHAISFVCDEFQHSVDESKCLDDAELIAS